MRYQSVLGVVAAGCAVLPMAARTDADVKLGMNLAGPAYYTGEVPWVDVGRLSQPFFSQELGQPWGVGVPLTLNADGYPIELPADHVAQSLWDPPQGFASGQYVLLYDGTGAVDVGLGAQQTGSSAGRVTFNMPDGPGRILTRITDTSPADPVRNIRIVPLAREADYASGTPAVPWRDDFLDRWSTMTGFRFMDWMHTNNSPISAWSERATPTSHTYAGPAGTSVEEMVALANHTGTSPWFTLPHQADDDYVRAFAIKVHDTLDPSLVARIEYSNEVWNGQFQQATYARQNGLAEGLSTNNFQAQLFWYSQRSVEIFEIFEDVFTNGGADPAGLDRLQRIMASQAANPWVSEQVLGFNDAWQHVDALAIAPYFGTVVNSQALADQFKGFTHEQLVQQAWADLDEAIEWMQNQSEVADDFGVSLFAYEGGQHYVGGLGFENDNDLTAVLHALNRDPVMRDLYFSYLTAWADAGGDDFMLFSSLGEPSKWGSWGLLETMDQDPMTSYKYLGVLDFMQSQIPEPSSLLSLAGACGAFLLRRTRR